jgi:hypothetical protein
MESQEFKILYETLLKSGMAHSENEAKEMAAEMLKVADQVRQNIPRVPQEVRGEFKEVDVQMPPIPKMDRGMEIPKEIIENVVNEKSRNNWSNQATNKIVSNNEIMKTIEEIGRGKPSDPNANLINHTTPQAYMVKKGGEVQNLTAKPKTGTNWLPSTNRFEERNKDINKMNESIQPIDVMTPTPDKPKMSPEEYSAKNMNGNVSSFSLPSQPIKRTLPSNDDLNKNAPRDRNDFAQFKEENKDHIKDVQPENDFSIDTEEETKELPKTEERKKGTMTEAEKKLASDVDLSKVFNFGARK